MKNNTPPRDVGLAIHVNFLFLLPMLLFFLFLAFNSKSSLMLSLLMLCFTTMLFVLSTYQYISKDVARHLSIGNAYVVVSLVAASTGGIGSPIAVLILCIPLLAPTSARMYFVWTTLSVCTSMGLFWITKVESSASETPIVRLLFILLGSFWVTFITCGMGKKFFKDIQHAEQEADLKSMFLATVSHELRTPLTTIIGWTDLLLLSKSIDVETYKHIQTIKTSSAHLLRIINDVLDYSKIEKGLLSLEETPFDLVKLVRSTIDYMAILKRDTVSYSTHVSLPRANFVHGDPHRLLQCLTNLLSNSAKFTHKGKIELSCSDNPPFPDGTIRVDFIITDTGIGISKNSLAKIFVPYYQCVSSAKYGGTGLGMTITKQLVERLGGNIDVQSELTIGTTFKFYVILKLGTAKAFRRHSQQMEVNPYRSLNILLAEDNISIQKVIATMLRKLSHTCTVVCDGAEAVEEAEKQAFDVILLDIIMPRMGGFEAAKNILAIPNRPHPPIIVALTASADALTRAAVLEVGMTDFLPKPVTYEDLRKCLNQQATRILARQELK